MNIMRYYVTNTSSYLVSAVNMFEHRSIGSLFLPTIATDQDQVSVFDPSDIMFLRADKS